MGSVGGGVRVECSTMNCSALSRARRWRTLRASLAGKVRSPSSLASQWAAAASQPAAQLALCLRVEPDAELLHGLTAHLEELVKVDAIGLQAQVELALLGKIVTAHQLLWQRAFHCIAQLPYQLLACPLLSLGTALCPG